MPQAPDNSIRQLLFQGSKLQKAARTACTMNLTTFAKDSSFLFVRYECLEFGKFIDLLLPKGG